MADSMSASVLYYTPTDPLNMKQIFFTSLQLLGFDKCAMEAKHTIPFNKDMFKLPNKIGAEVVLHFLFNRLNPIMCKEEFRDCWPITDKKKELQFRRTCCNWLTSISKEDATSHLPRIVASMFMSPGGDKFYQLLFSFSRYVLQHCLKTENDVKSRDCIGYPVLTTQNKKLADCTYNMLPCDLIRTRKSYLEGVQKLLFLHKEWKDYSSDLVKENRKLTKILRDVERDVRELKREIAEASAARGSPVHTRRSGGFSSETDADNIKRAQKVQKTRDLWKQVEDFYSSEKAARNVIDSILQCTVNKHKIDSSCIDVKVPDMLLKKCAKEIQKRQIDNTYQSGKVNLLSLVKLSNLSLHLYLEKLYEVGIPDYQDELARVSTQVHTHHAHVANAQALRTKMSELIPDIQASIEGLKHETYSTSQPSSPERIKTTALGFDLMPPTPPVSFTPDDKNTNFTPRKTLKITPDQVGVDTPEAAATIMRTVASKVRKGSDRLFPEDTDRPQVFNVSLNNDVERSDFTSKIPQFKSQHSVSANKKTEQKAVIQPRVKKKSPNLIQRKHTDIGKDNSVNTLNVKVVRETPPRTPAANHNIQSTPTGTRTKQNPAIKRIVRGQMPSQQPLTRSPAKMVTPKAFDILADKIVDAVAGNGTPVFCDLASFHTSPDQSPMDVNLKDPIAGLDQNAFITRDKLQHSPAKRGMEMEVRKMWRDSSIENPIHTSPDPKLPFQKSHGVLNSSLSSTSSELVTSESTLLESQSFSSNKSTPRPEELIPKHLPSEQISPSEKMARQIMSDIPCSPTEDFGGQFSAEFPIVSIPVNRRRLTMEDCGLDMIEAQLFDFDDYPGFESPLKENIGTKLVNKPFADTHVTRNELKCQDSAVFEGLSNKNNSNIEPTIPTSNSAMSAKGKRARSEEEEFALSLQRQSKIQSTLSPAAGLQDAIQQECHTYIDKSSEPAMLLKPAKEPLTSLNERSDSPLVGFNTVVIEDGNADLCLKTPSSVQVDSCKISSGIQNKEIDNNQMKNYLNTDGGISTPPSGHPKNSKQFYMCDNVLPFDSVESKGLADFNQEGHFDGEGLDDIEIPQDALHMTVEELFKTQTPTLAKRLISNTSVDSDISFNHFYGNNNFVSPQRKILLSTTEPCPSVTSSINNSNNLTFQSNKRLANLSTDTHDSGLFNSISDVNLLRTEAENFNQRTASLIDEESLNDSFVPFSSGIQVRGSSPYRQPKNVSSSDGIENSGEDIISRFQKLKKYTSQFSNYGSECSDN